MGSISDQNAVDSLSGATIPSATVAATDKILMQDVDDSDDLKTATAQSIADLASGGITLATPVAATSGTSITFSSIPAGTKRIIVMFRNLSISAADTILIQIGDSGGLENTGYKARAAFITTTVTTVSRGDGFPVTVGASGDAADAYDGSIQLDLENSSANAWVCRGVLSDSTSTGSVLVSSGGKALTGELDRVSITTAVGTATFDLGELNISFE